MGMLLRAIIRSFSVISFSHMSKISELRFAKAMLFKSDSLPEATSVDLFKVSNVFVVID